MKKKKKRAYTGSRVKRGSRWAGMILLVITALLSLWFYLQGQAGSLTERLFGSSTYEYTK